jgi:hypothetical protein
MKCFVREAHATALARLEETELVIQVRQVLLHGALGDRQLSGDVADRRGLGEDVPGNDGAAEGEQDVTLPSRELGRWRRGVRRSRGGVLAGPTKHDGRLPHDDLVPGAQGMRVPDPAAVHVGAVSGTEVANAPAGLEPLEDRVEPRQASVLDQGDIVRGRLPDGDAVATHREDPRPSSLPDLKRRLVDPWSAHEREPTRMGRDMRPPDQEHHDLGRIPDREGRLVRSPR